MTDYFEGWKNMGEVLIPPVQQKGFREHVLRRQKVDPYNMFNPGVTPGTPPGGGRDSEDTGVTEEDFNRTVIDSGEETTMLGQEDDTEETIILEKESPYRAVLIRKKTGEVYRITKAETLIGKSQEADLVVYENPVVSRQHARILSVNGEYYLEDMDSKNHTYLNGKKITEPTRLADKAQIRFADEEFLFELRQENGR